MRLGIPFVISAPSGVGKSTLIRGVRNRIPGLDFSVSHTTRPPRTGEADGVEYHFVDRGTFERMVSEGVFAEWAEVHGSLYGTSLAALEERLQKGRDVVLDIDVQGALQVAERVAEAVLIFVLPPSWGELRRRIETRRLDAPDAIARRMENARNEVDLAGRYDYVVINEKVEPAIQDLVSIIRAERCRSSRRKDSIDRLMMSNPREGRRALAGSTSLGSER